MEKIKDFLIMITTPGSEMPADVQITVILILAVLAILLPKLYRGMLGQNICHPEHKIMSS